MQKYLVAAALAAALGMGGAASAADVYSGGLKDGPVSGSTWTGFYLGVHGGWAGADLKTTDLDQYYFDGCCAPVLTTKQSPDGGFGGAQIGYNVQRGSIVAGVEADFGAMGISGSKLLNNPVEHETATVHISTGAYGDLTGRLGYSFGQLLVYGKGGIAFLQAKLTVEDPTEADGPPSFQNSQVGWTAGAGAEWRWSPSWSVKAEYLHFDFGTSQSTLSAFNNASAFFGFNHDLTVDSVKFGLNYHLNGYEPLK
jgi:outer membrane immunogenic protein